MPHKIIIYVAKIKILKVRSNIRGLEFQGGIHAQNLEIPPKKIMRTGDSHYFLEIIAFMK